MEIRTVNNIISNLLQLAIDNEWSGKYNVECHCHPRYVSCCKSCDALQYDQKTYQLNKHKDDCTFNALVLETRTYLEVENELAEKRGEETVYIP